MIAKFNLKLEIAEYLTRDLIATRKVFTLEGQHLQRYEDRLKRLWPQALGGATSNGEAVFMDMPMRTSSCVSLLEASVCELKMRATFLSAFRFRPGKKWI